MRNYFCSENYRKIVGADYISARCEPHILGIFSVWDDCLSHTVKRYKIYERPRFYLKKIKSGAFFIQYPYKNTASP